MAKKPDKGKKFYAAELAASGVYGPFQHLIDMAVRHQWTESEFEHNLVLSKPFQQRYPGLVLDGHLNPLMGASVEQAVNAYTKLAFQYDEIARNFGIKVGRDATGALIAHDVSPQEFMQRAQAVQTLKQNPELAAAFNEQLGAAGQKRLDKIGLLRFFSGAAPVKLYDIYEAASLRASGLNLSPDAAKHVAAALGTPGQLANTGQLVSQIKASLSDIGPELEKAGISVEELAISGAQQGLDAAGIGNQVRSILEQRRTQGSFVPGLQAKKGAAGGVALYNQEGAASGV